MGGPFHSPSPRRSRRVSGGWLPVPRWPRRSPGRERKGFPFDPGAGALRGRGHALPHPGWASGGAREGARAAGAHPPPPPAGPFPQNWWTLPGIPLGPGCFSLFPQSAVGVSGREVQRQRIEAGPPVAPTTRHGGGSRGPWVESGR